MAIDRTLSPAVSRSIGLSQRGSVLRNREFLTFLPHSIIPFNFPSVRRTEFGSICGHKFFWVQILLVVIGLLLSTQAMAIAPGCGDNDIGDITQNVQENTALAYDFHNCFTGGDTTGWKHTLSFPPAHGSVSVVGSVVTYTPNPNFTGADFFAISTDPANPPGTIGGDGALHDACTCNLQGIITVVAPVAQVPTLSQWAMIALGLLLVGLGARRLRLTNRTK